MPLKVDHLSCGYGNTEIISNLSFEFNDKVLAILGPNGVGKTTLFKAILGFLKPKTGFVYIDGVKTSSLSRRDLAKLLAYVPQYQIVPFSFPVEEFILMGRAPHLGLLQQPGPEDRKIVHDVMSMLGIEYLATKSCTGISGGELQLAFVARALVQQPRFLIMDEPTANLDYGNQTKVLECILDLVENGISVIITTHNPEQAFILESQVVLMQNKHDFICGDYAEVLTEEILHDTYDIDVVIRSFTHEGRKITACRTLPKCSCENGKKSNRA